MRRIAGLVAPLWLAAPFLPATAQPFVTSSGPESVEVTLYRAPNRSPETPIDLDWLDGYALISETRRVSLPAGESRIRFEGVAGGILPQSAIVTGFPEGVVERDHDAYLLSSATLLDNSLGRRVHLRRTSLATGESREQDAVIRSGAGGAVVLQTAEGIEALRCTGQAESLVYDEVPAGLSARPTLSVLARSREAVTVTVSLSYLASGFDWQANYVGTLSPDGRRVDLFAWLTLASSDETSFADADAQAVAGRVNREEIEIDPPYRDPLELRCWPQGTTGGGPSSPPPRSEDLLEELPQALAREVDYFGGGGDESIMVTGTRLARQEELGDLKLYRIPEPVTVAANSQKQVAFLARTGVEADIVYRQRLDPAWDDEFEGADRYLVTRNRTAEGLGVPLPGGSLQLFAASGGRPILIGEGTLRDHAVGEDVEIALGRSPGVVSRIEEEDIGDDWTDYRLTVTSDHAVPIRFETEFAPDEGVRFRARGRLSRRDGRPLWTATIPAHGSVSLRYRVVEVDE